MAQNASAHKLELEFEEEFNDEEKKAADTPEEIDLEFSATQLYQMDETSNPSASFTQSSLQVRSPDEDQRTETIITKSFQPFDVKRRKMSREERIDYFRKKRMAERQHASHNRPPSAETNNRNDTPLLLEDDEQISSNITRPKTHKSVQSQSLPMDEEESRAFTPAPLRPPAQENKPKIKLHLVNKTPPKINNNSESIDLDFSSPRDEGPRDIPPLNVSNADVAVAEIRGKIYAEQLSEAKLLEFKISLICKRLHKDSSSAQVLASQIQKLITEYRKNIKF